MTRINQKHFLYWILPLAILIPLITMYFSGVKWAMELVCPTVNWELGIVENLQLLVLLLIFIIGLIGIKRRKVRIEKAAMVLLSIFTAFVFLEEMDYGLHYVQYFTGESNTLFRDVTGAKNLHNLGNNARLFKRPFYPLMAMLFIVGPLVVHKIKSPMIRFFIPHKIIIATAIITVFSYLVPRLLVDWHIFPDGGFKKNIGEFSELMMYYIFFLYLKELIFEKESFLKPKGTVVTS
ncbi:hypothetical protein [Carboxylicivirga marina]|uniref:Uncharacterized protein n=1 Tax=Carboxylicivirga marina TaxID=2800988 RepID=A0ABS1HNK2_9BACT|nr:hypothetical protein [Carboxylicivirga marina]MBK3519112.1 hypothetical protein [Carboxylicivirga marina]